MDSWPANDRNDHTTSTGRKAKPKRKEKDVFPNYPDIVQGSLNAVTLTERGGGLEWLSVMKGSANGRTRLHMEKPTMIFPTTRPPALHIPQSTVLQRAEQGANFLRTFLPDVDIPAELIRDEIAQDARVLRDLTHFDPYLGNLLEPVVIHDSPSEIAALLAFPMGELNCELNISPLLYSETEGTSFKPSAHPIHKYYTPIQQITSSKPRADIFQNSCVAVRTFGLTSLLKLIAPVSTNQRPQMIEMATVQHADVGKRAIVDFKLSASPIEALAVNDCGGLYRFTFDNGLKTPYLVHAAAVVDDQDSFWRVALGENDTTGFLMSTKALNHLDFRADGHLNLFSVSTPQDMLTSVEDDDGSNVIRLCSTREILWIDKRFPGKPLLGYRHGRNWDRSLGTQTLNTSHALTLLTSRTNSLVTVYDISRSTESLLHLTMTPYYLWPENVTNGSHCGQAFFRHPSASLNEDFNMFQLSDRGSIHQFGLRDSPQSDNSFKTFWSNDMKKLAQQASVLRLDYGPLGPRDSSEADLVPPYDYMFRAHVEEKRQAEEENADAFYNLLDQIPTFWRDSDAPVEQMLTTYDVFFRTGGEPTEASRADFLTEGIMNSTRGYRALIQDRLSAQHLRKDAAWHYNITPVLKKLDPGFPRDAQEWNESLQRHNLVEDPDRPISSTRREKEAREQLILDLMLSTDVFSAQKFSNSSHGNLELENMTKTLSLAGEPPDVDFGYLRPLPKNTTDHYTKTENDEVTISIGARTLVKEWDLGADPDEHTFRDHYDGTVDPQAIQRMKSVKPLGQFTEPPQIILNTQSQRPPLLVATTTLPLHKPEVHMRSILKAQSSLVLPRLGSQVAASGPPAASQGYMANTQVLPGPYGGRPSMGKKKVTKKRLGGF